MPSVWEHRHFVFEFLMRQQHAIVGRPVHRAADRRGTARDRRKRANRTPTRQRQPQECMTDLMVSENLSLVCLQDLSLCSDANKDALDRIPKVRRAYPVGATPRGEQRGLVDEACEISAGKSWS